MKVNTCVCSSSAWCCWHTATYRISEIDIRQHYYLIGSIPCIGKEFYVHVQCFCLKRKFRKNIQLHKVRNSLGKLLHSISAACRIICTEWICYLEVRYGSFPAWSLKYQLCIAPVPFIAATVCLLLTANIPLDIMQCSRDHSLFFRLFF